ncbi:DUF2247 family protein [Streptomyces caatingaensis]|uniref:DUF2247 domain-containing protein n=1 Tax=Streptomyces caatingaensis TaxID=1678637 RepID=A0A0K9X9A0_9ACTN|nr:DUF2247 family protein [Streptomyces caatingaensis]KNB49778.1 hypothetical protein AC230_23665 [Streptomyces caatingaensis]
MREVWPRFNADSFLDPGFPYPGELAYGYRNELIDTHLLTRVIDALGRNYIPLTPEELEITMLLSDEVDQIRHLALQLAKYEHKESSKIWQYYFTSATVGEIRDPVEKFEALDSIWADLGYPDAMIYVLYPEEGKPAHLHPMLGEKALSNFLARWSQSLAQREPMKRLRASE